MMEPIVETEALDHPGLPLLVGLASPEQQGQLGTGVSAWAVDLPIAETDPLARLAAIREQTADLKASKRALGAETLTQTIEWTGSGLLSLGSRLVTLGTPFNMAITNVPGIRAR